jgi:hypothetical protein
VNYGSTYDAGTYGILICILNSCEDQNSQYNALMHSTQSCLLLGLPNILSSLSNFCFIPFSPHLSVLQCHHLIKANHCNKSVMQFHQPSHHFIYIMVQRSHHTGVKHPQCLTFPQYDRPGLQHKRQVKLHFKILYHCLHTDRQTDKMYISH